MAASREGGFSWVHLTNSSVLKAEDRDVEIVKSHAIRALHRRNRQRRTKAADHGQSQQSTSDHQQTALPAGASRRLADQVTYHPATDWEQVALCQFIDTVVQPDRGSPVIAFPVISFQYLSFLPDLYGRNFARSCLTEAITSVALARLANLHRVPDFGVRARKAYVNALSLVNESMLVREEQNSDQVLAALCMLARYELISGDSNESVFQFREQGQVIHDKGMLALVQQRDQAEMLQSDAGVSLFRLIYIRHLLTCVATSERPSISLSYSSSCLAFPAPCLRRLMGLIRRIADLRSQLAQTSDFSTGTHQLAEYAVAIDAHMSILAQQLPTHTEHIVETTSAPPDPQQSGFWQFFWQVFFYGRLYILQTLLHFPEAQTGLSRDEIGRRLMLTVDDICAGVPHWLVTGLGVSSERRARCAEEVDVKSLGLYWRRAWDQGSVGARSR